MDQIERNLLWTIPASFNLKKDSVPIHVYIKLVEWIMSYFYHRSAKRFCGCTSIWARVSGKRQIVYFSLPKNSEFYINTKSKTQNFIILYD
ncbi:hypothetical protein DC20_15610 [Rufibacter tibetensis]|uniref:Uncharacterized protein n=1 Tax=Rufibacter tibetensis TaxID=512763 RepID=A0A0P0C5C9_9BACT|nr:hypothetical protein DC20_15610 [Rufibacter tibetensis]